MKTRDARAIGEAITAGIHFPGGFGGGWDDVTWGSDDARWPSDLLGRIVLLVGDQPIEYVSGYVDNDERIHGDVVVLTTVSIIRATFSLNDGQLDATVRATNRSSISHVEVLSAASMTNDDAAEWPAWVSAVVTTVDGSVFPLPLVKRRQSATQTSTGAIISKLLAQ
jgi:hypothetical protein